jgi:RHH-type proline utilization regulon transcriptional repressor/proline dehydrogenase/delta 1-pyrroline-5-carboxylate dehydrogenase
VIDWLADLAQTTGQRIPVRLVKGAYWDSEIKHAQVEGYDGYPVFTRKASTDVSYIACARKVLARRQAFYPQFATHNAHTVAVVTELAGDRLDYEFQRLHGMGEDLYGVVMNQPGFRHTCRVYAPVGNHADLLPYLVRRLLENGSNTSFVNRIVDDKLAIEEVAAIRSRRVAATEPVATRPFRCRGTCTAPSGSTRSGVNLDCDAEVYAPGRGHAAICARTGTWNRSWPAALEKTAASSHGNINRPAWPMCARFARPAWRSWNKRSPTPAPHTRVGSPPGQRAGRHAGKSGDLMEGNAPEFMALCARERQRPCMTRSPRSAKPRIFSGTTRCRPGRISTRPWCCRARPANTTS